MKKLLALLCTLGIAQPAMAANLNLLGNLAQTEFRAFSEDLGSALSYKPITPAASLGITGFDIGVEVTQTSMSKSAQAWNTATGGTTINNLIIPKVHVAKGFPFGIDVAAFYSKVPTTTIALMGGELRYAVLDGGLAMPTVAVRGAFTKLSGVDLLSFDTKSLDISISKGFLMFTPYAGVGQVWVNSTAAAATGLAAEKFGQSKVFAGANLNMGFTNLAAEVDKTGGAQSVSVKLGFRF